VVDGERIIGVITRTDLLNILLGQRQERSAAGADPPRESDLPRTRSVIKNIYARMEKEKLGDKVKFGLVAFRSAHSAVPAIEYNTRMYADPTTVKNGADFFAKIKDLRATKISTPKFDEDAYAGLKEALEKINWNEFGARYIVLVTDAGALDSNDPLSTTGLDAQAVRELAKEKGVALYVMHLKTPAGVKNHQTPTISFKTSIINTIRTTIKKQSSTTKRNTKIITTSNF
jgi:hypothetical protein